MLRTKSQLSPLLSNSLLEHSSENDLNLPITFSNKDNGTIAFNKQMARILRD